jgi:hypothetical protein
MAEKNAAGSGTGHTQTHRSRLPPRPVSIRLRKRSGPDVDSAATVSPTRHIPSCMGLPPVPVRRGDGRSICAHPWPYGGSSWGIALRAEKREGASTRSPHAAVLEWLTAANITGAGVQGDRQRRPIANPQAIGAMCGPDRQSPCRSPGSILARFLALLITWPRRQHRQPQSR